MPHPLTANGTALFKASILAGIALAFAVFASPATAQIAIDSTVALIGNNEHSKTVTVENIGNTERTYRVSLIDFQMAEDGKITLGAADTLSKNYAGGMVRLSPRQFTLQPGAAQLIRFQISPDQIIAEGEYQAYTLIQQVPEIDALETSPFASAAGVALNLQAVFGMAIPLIIRHGDLSATVTISDAHLETLADGRRIVALRLNRSGNRSARGDLSFTVAGTKIGTVSNIWVPATIPYRNVQVPVDASALAIPAGQTSEIEITFSDPALVSEHISGRLSPD